MKTLQKLRKNKKGFTLVELLVVLVIMAILAAAIIPSMMGFIDKAKEETASAECRSALMAADVVLNEDYGTGATAKTPYAISVDKVMTMADFKGTSTTAGPFINSITTAGTPSSGTTHPTIAAIDFYASNGTHYTYAADTGWTKATT